MTFTINKGLTSQKCSFYYSSDNIGDIYIGGERDFTNNTFVILMRLPWNAGVAVKIKTDCVTSDNTLYSSVSEITANFPERAIVKVDAILSILVGDHFNNMSPVYKYLVLYK